MKLLNNLQKAASGHRDPPKENDISNGDSIKKNLPSEQDRKATLGCLAAVLNIMFEHQFCQHPTKPKRTSNKSQRASSSSSRKVVATTATTTTATTDFSGDGGDDYNVDGVGVSAQRTREFQKELLLVSTEMLYLDPDVHAVQFLSILNNRDGKFQSANDDDTDSTRAAKTSSTEKRLLDPFLSSFSNAEAGFRCVSLLLFRFLLLSHNNGKDDNDRGNESENASKSQTLSKKPKTIIGYDSRVRYAFKYLSVSIFKFWDPIYGTVAGSTATSRYTSEVAGRKYATRKFEALEDAITYRISNISKKIIVESAKQNQGQEKDLAQPSSPTMTTKAIKKRNKIIRGMKIGSAAVGAGALIAITGGIAVPAMIGGIAAVAGVTALSFGTLAAISLLVLPAAVTIFGVGSGVLVATKMSTRTKGLTDFDIQPAADYATANHDGKEKKKGHQSKKQGDEQQRDLKLSRTICINGWIADKHDFERPFGMQPNSLTNKSELLKRYCSVYAPQVIPNCDDILKEWANNENELWSLLRDAYGRDPNSLYPLDNNYGDDVKLTKDENDSINMMLGSIMGIQPDMMQTLEEEMKSNDQKKRSNRPLNTYSFLDDVLNYKKNTSTRKLKQNDAGQNGKGDRDVLNDKKFRPYVAWDFQSTYKGMELYTVSWEKELLMELRGSAKDLQKDLAMMGAEKVMKKTVFAALMSAVAVPATLIGLTSLIDEKWTLANERADEAGILLAESLLMSTAGHRPVNLIGISFGSRMIISCLTELSRHQKKWEKEQQLMQEKQNGSGRSSRRKIGASNLLKVGDEIRKNISDNVTSKLGNIKNNSRDNGANESTTTSYIREPASIIENVILMGCPATVKESTWKSIRGVVAGRLINCYSGNDLMLSLMYRIKNPMTALVNPPVGISEVRECGVTNFDVSNLINSKHGEYCLVVQDILDLIGFDQPGGGH